MKQRIILIFSCCATLVLIFALSSCREDAIIKSSLTPAVDNIHTFGLGLDFNNGTDTMQQLTIRTKTAYEDSIITSSRSGFPVFHALGWLNDPFAGKTAAGIYMEVAPTVAGFKLGDYASTIDSIVLVLPYAGFTWGDTNSTTTTKVNLYSLSDSLRLDTTYYNFSSQPTTGNILASATFQAGPLGTGSLQDSVNAGGINRAPHLRLKLSTPQNTAYNAVLLAALDSDATFPSFRSQLKGFCIMPDTAGMGAATLPYFRLNPTSADIYGAAALLVYAHANASGPDTVFQFPYQDAYTAHFNRITRNYTPAVNNLLYSTDPNAATVVMQNGPGTSVDLWLPYIQNLPKNVIINKAELVFTKVSSTDDNKFFGPARLYPTGINSTGGRYTIADRYSSNLQTPLELLDFMDGTPQTVVKGTNTLTQYRINIPREIQRAIVQGSNGLHLRIGGTVNYPAAYRLLMGGSGATDATYRPSINIIYSKQ